MDCIALVRNVINGTGTPLVVTFVWCETCAGFVPEVNQRVEIPRKNRVSPWPHPFFSVFFGLFRSPQASFGNNPLLSDDLRSVRSSFR